MQDSDQKYKKKGEIKKALNIFREWNVLRERRRDVPGLSMICRAVATRKNGIAFRFRQNSRRIPKTRCFRYIPAIFQDTLLPANTGTASFVE